MAFQLGSNLLEACVLAVVMQEDVYGYKLTQEIKEIMDVSESTLYPVLRRLQKEGYLDTYDQPYQGRNRRYYSITAAGRIKFNEYWKQWNGFRDNIDRVMNGGRANEQR